MADAVPQKVATLGTQIKTIRDCKICQSAHRGEIEDLLTLRSRGQVMQDGVRPTELWFVENAPARWGIPLNRTNLATHFNKHFQAGALDHAEKLVVKGTRAELEKQVREQGITAVAPEEFLETIVSIAHKRVQLDPGAVTVDQGMKAVAELTKRKHDEQTATLMAGLVGAVQSVAQGRQQQDPEVIVVVDAEVLDEPDTESGGGVGGEQGAGGNAALVLADRVTPELPTDQKP